MCLAWLPWLTRIAAFQTTKTEMHCQTYLAGVSPYAIASHTSTITTNAADVTVEFTTRESITLATGPRKTYTRTKTFVSTITETVTESQIGDTFTTTSTIYKFKRRFYNVTTTINQVMISAQPHAIDLQIPTPDGFVAINATTTPEPVFAPFPEPTSTSPPAVPVMTAAPDSPPPEQIVYILVEGKLVPTPLSAISSLISDTAISIPLPTFDPNELYDDDDEAENTGAPSADHVDDNTVNPAGKVAGPLPTAPPVMDFHNDGEEPEWEQELYFTLTDASTEKVTAETIIGAVPTRRPPHVNKANGFHGHNHHPRHVKRDEVSEPKTLMGFRGAQMKSLARTPVDFPTMVSCTKSIVVENTVWRPMTDSPTFLPQLPLTTTITSLTTITVTSTVPDRTVATTASYVTTATLTTTKTHDLTSTEKNTVVYTVSSTKTSYMACATPNILGPIGVNDTHIVNVYSHGPWSYTHYDRGFSKSAEDCCIECHTMDKACMGSIFTEGRCYLVTDRNDVCSAQGVAGYFVSRPRDDRPKKGRRWPDYVLSNGPCGAFSNAGTGW
ncbi:hypothetical protein ANO11243_004790 [Dothideomycetidae sp. 11243]|nr:hypothetical protein ANO11243_004790 [fungal sp. No.11243]